MNLYRFKKVSEYDVINLLEKRGIEFSVYQKQRLPEVLRDSPYHFIVFEKPVKSHPLFRLTAPFYFICFCLLFIAMPFKWLLTGKSYYNYDGRIVKTMKKWYKLFYF